MTAPGDWAAQATIGGLTFNTDAADAVVSAQQWYAAVLGWEACPKRVVTLPNVHSDGDQPQFMTLAARPLTLQGTVKVSGSNPQLLLAQAKDRLLLATMAHPDALVTLTVAEPTPTSAGTFAQVHLAEDAPQWNVRGCDDTEGVADFRVGLVVPGGAKLSVAEVVTPMGASGLATPVPTAPTTAAAGGSLVPGVYGYRVSAVGSPGESLASPTQQAVIGQLPTPGSPAVSAGAGGTLPLALYSYRVSAVNGAGETLASAFPAFIYAAGAVTVTWSPVAGATGYNVYGRSFGAELKMTAAPVTDTTFIDTGAVTPSGALPVANTTATNANTVTLSWSPVAGATGYNVYGRTPGAELKLTAVPIAATTYTDTGAATPSGAPPSAGGASVSLTNLGNWPAAPRLTVAGPAAGPVTLGRGSMVVRVDTALGSGETLVIDFATMDVMVNGVDRRDFLNSSSQWWKLPAGISAVNYAGGGTATVRHRHTYG